ncbi:hypothetical protein D3C86_2210860 [compost metagenome]
MVSQPANEAITSCKAKAIPAPVTPSATVTPPNLSLKTTIMSIIIKKPPIKPLVFFAL